MKKLLLLLVLTMLLVSACAPQPTPTPLPTAAPVIENTPTVRPPTATPAPSATPEPTLTATPATELFPTVTFTQKVICRLGTDVNYFPVVTFTPGQTSRVENRSFDAQWLMIDAQTPNKNPTCWVPVASVEAVPGLENLLVSAPPPLPAGPISASVSPGVCGVNRQGPITLTWSQGSAGTGYYIYRNGKNIATVYGGLYLDRDTPASKTPYTYTYGIQAFNSVGLSKVTASASVTLCK